jgi:hypothetical protein
MIDSLACVAMEGKNTAAQELEAVSIIAKLEFCEKD